MGKDELAETPEDIGACITGLMAGFDEELFSKSREELEEYWFFEYDPSVKLDRALYVFYDRLTLYATHCHRWEEHHNGHICVVERVRDRYLMPKIRELIASIVSQQKETSPEA